MPGGLTYSSDQPLLPGTLVLVPLRSKQTEGMVIGEVNQPAGKFAIKSVSEVLDPMPILPAPLLKTAQWMSEYYCCSIRQTLQVFLPAPPWKNVAPEHLIGYEIGDLKKPVRGSKRKKVIEFVSDNPGSSVLQIQTTTGAGSATIRGLIDLEILKEVKIKEVESPTPPKSFPQLKDADKKIIDDLLSTDRPSLLTDNKPGDDRTDLYAALAARVFKKGKSSLLLYPDGFSADYAFRKLKEIFGNDLLFLHSGTGIASRRKISRELLKSRPKILVGTRTALFSPTPILGLVILDNEQEWTFKSEQTPRYHTRLTAEVLCKFASAKLVLASSTPSLEALQHAMPIGGKDPPRYHLVERKAAGTFPKRTLVVDLTSADFGKSYPLTTPLLDSLKDRLSKQETSVLLLNRKGTATSLMCFECKRSVTSPVSNLPMSVVNENGRPMLLDRPTGYAEPVPAVCPQCRAAKLNAVGAGTEGVESTLRRLLPDARIARADSDSLDRPEKISLLLTGITRGEIDILVGTQPVLKALGLPRVSLASVLIADIGLSHPDFRSGERVFKQLTRIISQMNAKPNGLTIIQTFRTGAPEIACAVEGRKEEYWTTELAQRAAARYPPFSQMIRLIVRGKGVRERTEALFKFARDRAEPLKINVAMTEEYENNRRIGTITLRGNKPRDLLKQLPLRDVSVDVDPAE
jgi:primosomal protein N' (replication factor Y)